MNETQTRVVPNRLRSQRFALGVVCAALVLGTAGTSRADDPPENVAAARTLGIQGAQLADAGKCPEAIEKLQRAESLHHAPTILGRLGECQVNVGDIVEGTENLNAVVREPLAATAPKVFYEAQDRARKVLTAATPKIAHLIIRTTPSDAKATVTVSGKPVPLALIGAERPTNPGTHEVLATAEGYKPASATVTLTEGGRQDITLLLERDPNAVTASPAGAATTPPVPDASTALPPTEAETKPSHTGAYVAFGIGGLGLLVGSITGGLALSKASDCPGKVCKTQSDLDSAKTMANVSTVSFGIGIAGAAVGAILLLTGKKTESPPAAAARPAPRLAMQPWFGLNAAGVSGSFQ